MSKRFRDTEVWNKRFIRNLTAPHKLLWFYILDECNHAGIWDVDFQVAQLKIGMKLRESEALNALKEKIVPIDNGKKWFIPDFVDFQYGQLSDQNRAHQKVIFLLKRQNLLDVNLLLRSPLQAPYKEDIYMDKEMEEEKEEDKEEEKEGQKLKMTLFKNSKWFDFALFEKEFINTDYSKFNIRYYYEAVLNWSDSKQSVKKDWIATTRNFMLKDAKDGKAVLQGQNLMQNGTTKNKSGHSNSGDIQSAHSKIDAMYGPNGQQ